MNYLKFILVGFVFGIVLTKSEAVSWYRIYEMFLFQSFHMYGIIIVAICTGIAGIQIIKKFKINDIKNKPIVIQPKEKGSVRYWVGGVIFGFGWALVGACLGPIFILLGAGFWRVLPIFTGAVIGTFLYGVILKKLPH